MPRKILLILLNLFILACILLVAIGPLLATFTAGSIANAAGCQLDEGSIHPCLINGVDYGETLYTLGMMAWFTFASVPAAVVLLLIYLLVWGVILVVRLLRKPKPQTNTSM